MLIATPYRDFDIRDKSPPKVISEVRKTYLNCAGPNLRPKLTGDLLIKTPQDKLWHRRRTQIRGGQLHVSPVASLTEDLPPITAIRLPLRHLSLQAGPLPHSLALCRGQNVVLMLQTESEQIFDEWVRTVAIELIRQTPLDAIKYLDILTLAECYNKTDQRIEENHTFPKQTNLNTDLWSKRTPFNHILQTTNQNSLNTVLRNRNGAQNIKNSSNPIILRQTGRLAIYQSSNLCKQNSVQTNQNTPDVILWTKNEQIEERNLNKDCNQNVLVDELDSPLKSTCQSCTKNQEVTKKNPGRILEGICLRKSQEQKTPIQQTDQEKLVENLLKKCQNSESYVPVKEKLVLFESLCKVGRKVRSTEDVSLKPETSSTKRAKSLHDLSNINTHLAVRDICKYFENKQEHFGALENTNVLKSRIVKRLNFEKCIPNTENLYRFQKVIVI